MRRTRVYILGLAAICIAGLLAVQGTLAFTVARSSTADNHFVFLADGLNAVLTETAWKESNAEYIVPGSEIAKNPQIKNTCGADEWSAIKVTFCYGPEASGIRIPGEPMTESDLAKVLDAVTINWNTSDWIRFDDSAAGDSSLPTAVSQTFFYNSKLKAASFPAVSASTTRALFTFVSVNEDNTQAQMMELKNMGGFQIYIEGCVIQSEVSASMTPAEANASFTFDSTP